MSEPRRRGADERIDEIEKSLEHLNEKIDRLAQRVESLLFIFEKGSSFLWVMKAFGSFAIWVGAVLAGMAAVYAAIKYGAQK